jgi:mono/diheme cytochrome c family protein
MPTRETGQLRRRAETLIALVSKTVLGPIIISTLLLAASCSQQMANQPSIKPLETSSVFPNGQAARQPVAGTVPSGFSRMNRRIAAQPVADVSSNVLPFPLTIDVLERGRERFDINCAVCHGRTGDGDGMIVRRGYSRPPTFHDDRLRNAPLGHFYDVMTNGFGGMPSYAAQIEPQDRWAIAAYIRALQLSQNATLNDVPPDRRSELEK